MAGRSYAISVFSALVLAAGVSQSAAEPPSAAPAGSESNAALLTRLADDGNAGAQVQLATHFEDGSGGFAKNPRLAAKWFELAALQGNAYAQMRLGDLYAEGTGVARNLKVAADWRQKAANRGNAQAQLKLGTMYLSGDGIEKNGVRAAYWFERASIGGNAEASDRLADLQRQRTAAGRASGKSAGQPPSPVGRTDEQANWVVHLFDNAEFRIEEAWYHRNPEFEQLAEDGDPRAQFMLGSAFLQGRLGRARDVGRALGWYRRAAEGGSQRAAQALARVYEHGLDGVASDPREARQWAERAESLSR